MKLVEIRKFDLVTNSLAIAEFLERKHESVIKFIDRKREDLEEFCPIEFEYRPTKSYQGGGKPCRVAWLKEQHTAILITLMRSMGKVPELKKRLVMEFSRRDEYKNSTI